MAKSSSLKDWAAAVRRSRQVALLSHVNPDGDTIGAALALRLALLSMGKDAVVICDDTVPEKMLFLPGSGSYIRPEQAEGMPFDLAIAVDVSTLEMLGTAAEVFQRTVVRLVIDHHATNPFFGDIHYIRGGESSCCLLAYEAIRELGVALSIEMGTCLMLGMSTDTGHFQYTCTTPETLSAAADLLRLGVDISDISRRMYRQESKQRMMLMRCALNNLHFACGGQVGIIVLDREAFASAGCTLQDADGLVNMALEIEGVRMAFLLTERGQAAKASLRAVEPDTVNDIALALGGGGHAQAAGCTLNMPLAEAEQVIIRCMAEKLGAV